MAKILVIDDERSVREFLEIMLQGDGHAVDTAPDGETGLERLAESDYDLVLTDLKMREVTGMDVLRAAKRQDPSLQVVVLTAFGTTEAAVAAMKDGAADFLTKPFKVGELKVQLNRALKIRDLQRENIYLKEQLAGRGGMGDLVGTSEAMRRIYDLIARLARTRTNVLITGESGTGKELVARAIHDRGADAGVPFVAVNCGAIPATLIESELFGHVKGAFTGAHTSRSGVFEAAGHGTLFLDEVGELPLEMQVKLLRVLQERRVTRVGSTRERDLHCRVVAATNQDLEQAVRQGRFREDLYYRLNVVQIHVPPLRERPEDVPQLAQHFLEKYAEQSGQPLKGITKVAMACLLAYRYDGNVRELENAIQRAMALTDAAVIDIEALPHKMRTDRVDSGGGAALLPEDGMSLDDAVDRLERSLLEQALQRTGGVRKQAAKLLGITFRSLRYRLDKHDIDADQYANEGR